MPPWKNEQKQVEQKSWKVKVFWKKLWFVARSCLLCLRSKPSKPIVLRSAGNLQQWDALSYSLWGSRDRMCMWPPFWVCLARHLYNFYPTSYTHRVHQYLSNASWCVCSEEKPMMAELPRFMALMARCRPWVAIFGQWWASYWLEKMFFKRRIEKW